MTSSPRTPPGPGGPRWAGKDPICRRVPRTRRAYRPCPPAYTRIRPDARPIRRNRLLRRSATRPVRYRPDHSPSAASATAPWSPRPATAPRTPDPPDAPAAAAPLADVRRYRRPAKAARAAASPRTGTARPPTPASRRAPASDHRPPGRSRSPPPRAARPPSSPRRTTAPQPAPPTPPATARASRKRSATRYRHRPQRPIPPVVDVGQTFSLLNAERKRFHRAPRVYLCLSAHWRARG